MEERPFKGHVGEAIKERALAPAFSTVNPNAEPFLTSPGFEAKRAQLFRMVSDVRENPLALLNTSGSVSVGRAKIRSDRRNPSKNVRPATLDAGNANE